MIICRAVPKLLVGCSVVSTVAGLRWLPFDLESAVVKAAPGGVQEESVNDRLRLRRDGMGASEVPPVDLPYPPVLETPPPAGPGSLCDYVPVDTWAMESGIIYEATAINSMYLCIQNNQFTPGSNAQLDSALHSAAVTPRIDQMCADFYPLTGRQYSVGDKAVCQPLMIDLIKENTLYILSERAADTTDPTSVAPSPTDAPTSITTPPTTPVTTEPATPISTAPVTPPSGATSSICDQVPVEARLSADGVVFEGVAIDSMCLCLQNGRYTAESQAQLDSALSATSLVPRIDELCRDYYVALGRQYTDQDAQTCPPALIDSIQANTLHTLSQRSTTCIYPPSDFTPVCGGDCAFVCNPGFAQCGDANPRCVPLGTSCATGGLRKRNTLWTTCPQGSEACPISSNAQLRRRGNLYECLSTQTDIESCGGCIYPLPGARPGTDCTEIPGAEVVQCLGGKCVVNMCRKGFSLIGNTCIGAPTSQVSFWENVLQR